MTRWDLGMRLAAAATLGLGLSALLATAGTSARAEYYCSPGFVPSYGGRCVATAARDEIELYLNDATLLDERVVRHRHHRRHGLRALY